MQNKIAIVGGGIAGLSAAYYLTNLTHFKPVVFEATGSLGGLAKVQTINIKGKQFKIEKFYHHFFAKDKYLKELLKKLGLVQNLVFRKVKNNYGTKKYNICSSGLLLAATFLPWQFLVKIPVKFWYKFCNKKLDYLQTLFLKKFGQDYKELNTAWLWARIHARFSFTDLFAERLGVIEPNLEILINKLASEITQAGGQILLNFPVNNIKNLCKQGYKNIIYTGSLAYFNTFMQNTGIKIVPPKYLGAFNIVLITEKTLSSYYWDQKFVMKFKNLPLLVKVEQSLLNKALPYNVTYLGGYASESQIAGILKQKTHILKRVLNQLEIRDVLFADIWGTKIAQHIPTVHYVKHMPKEVYKLNDCRVFLVTFGNILPWDRGVNTAIFQGKKVVEKYFLL